MNLFYQEKEKIEELIKGLKREKIDSEFLAQKKIDKIQLEIEQRLQDKELLRKRKEEALKEREHKSKEVTLV